MSSEIDELVEGLMRSAAVVEGLRRRKKTTPNETFEAPKMPSTVPGISIDVLDALDKSPTATPAPSRINSEPSSPVGGPDNLRIEAVLEGHYPSPTATPYNTRPGSPERGVSVRPHTAGQAVETMAKLEELAVGRGEKGYIDDDEAATRARHGKNFGPTRYLNFIFSIHGMKSNKDMLFKLPTALDPANAYKRDGTASNTGSKSAKDILLKGSTIFNSSTAFKRDGSTKILVNVADGSVNFSTSTKVEFLLFYFMANLGLTLYNKYIMLKHSSPYLLTALHCLSGVIGTQVLFRSGAFTLKPLTTKDKLRLSLFSILYTLNIAVSNASLDLVSVPFHQVVRAISPVFTIGIYRIVFSATYTTQTYISLIPVMAGVGLATYGDYNATTFGFLMTVLGAILAAVKTVTTNRMQTSGLHLSALELLYRMSPYAFMQSLILAYYHGEFNPFSLHSHLTWPGPGLIAMLVVNSALAFTLNYTSFSANKKVGALTMAVAANVKQILTVVLSILLWNLKVDYLNVCGILGTLAGGAWYSAVELVGKEAEDEAAASAVEEGKGEKI